MAEPTQHDVYKLHRAYIEHEDRLINHRTTWLITIQSFLMATFGFTYQKRFEVAAELHHKGENLSSLGAISDEYSLFMVALALIGLAVSLLALVSVRAAAKSIGKLDTSWNRYIGPNPPPHFPGVTGGGDDDAARTGVWLSSAIPAFFSSVWCFALVFLLFRISVR